MRMPRLSLLVGAAALAFCLTSCSTTETGGSKNTLRTFNTVVVDAGHGGRDNGATRRYGPPEKIVALDVAQRLRKKLNDSQLHTVMTRNSDVFIPLDERVAIGNRQSNSIFVSIHFNDATRRGVHGFEVYYSSASAADLAQRIQKKLMRLPKAVNRGAKPARFRVLRNAHFPSVLVECGFLSNRGEGEQAGNANFRDKLADCISEAIVEERFGSGVYNGPPNSVPPVDSTSR
jgi:N-acetylmuramoyl-L-alanine amidase